MSESPLKIHLKPLIPSEICISVPWFMKASMLSGKASAVAFVLLLIGSIENRRVFKFGISECKNWGLDIYGARRGLRALELADLVTVERYWGRTPIVAILEAPKAEPVGQ